MIGVFPSFGVKGMCLREMRKGENFSGVLGGKKFDLQEQINESAFRFVRFFDVWLSRR